MEKGIWVSLITPFDEAGALDLESARKYLNFLKNYDFAGFLLGGSVGEGLLLSPQELASYVKLAREILNKPIMIGVADFSYERAKEKLALDYDYALVTPTIYFKPHAQATIDYFNKVANTANGKVMLYNNPGRVGVPITEQIYDAVYENEKIVSVKECQDEYFDHFSNKYTNWNWFTGNDDYFTNDFFINFELIYRAFYIYHCSTMTHRNKSISHSCLDDWI